MTLSDIFEAAGVRGFLHARSLGSPVSVDVDADSPVVLASVVKVALAYEFARQVAAGQLDPTDRVHATAADRLGGSGSAGFADDVSYSLRDAALLALSVSDNTAADLLFDRVGVANVRSLLAELGLTRTSVIGAPRDLLRTIIDDTAAGLPLRALDPLRTSASTPREMTALLSALWSDPGPGAQVLAWMSAQVSWHRLTAGFPPEVTVAAKTGTMPGIRNEIGVVTYPDGTAYAVAVFTVGGAETLRRPDIDRAIGDAARAAVDQLRS
ncbi:Beta-lactamase class A-like and penicillin binding proteins (PBPs) superfamily [Amycolatopsis camponoti]|uniref:Beta-lactamase class A-like and penicillin binding proteins (PBPs) superfamily n=1 Tax=Amycolatopsis camponoti TaxID=2606593 RepID=A0A6I8LHC4_9PSEU|nr:serine hydrolase [Amycolatopsis camponoti]VVJ16491.1 Beta-lactamase class A-like and penicillin binding proteins (PBPs) superfamily [Amycolatopsis camponoti]